MDSTTTGYKENDYCLSCSIFRKGIYRMENEKMYYYTDFKTFKMILQNGTLCFKESTSSNDKLDTRQVYENLMDMAKRKYEETGIAPEQKFYFDMLKHNGSKPTRFSLVACFTSKADSRMLWDAYTMHRKDRNSERYNGVCIEFSKKQLLKAMDNGAKIFDIRKCQNIIYGFDEIDERLEQIMDDFSKEVQKLSRDEDQTQNIIKPIPIPFTDKVLVLKKSIVIPLFHLIDKFDVIAPYYKHSFWHEECETRALLLMKLRDNSASNIKTYENGSKYFDLPIDKVCISNVILGPEFSDADIKELKSIDGKIKFKELYTKLSEGTGVITNK